MEDLGTLPGDAISEALGINNHGQVVGVSFAAGFANPRGFVWQDGTMTDINTLTPSNSTLSVLFANDINDFGVITGEAFDSGTNTSPAILAIPVLGGSGDDRNTSQRPAIPEDVRERLLHRLGVGNLGH